MAVLDDLLGCASESDAVPPGRLASSAPGTDGVEALWILLKIRAKAKRIKH